MVIAAVAITLDEMCAEYFGRTIRECNFENYGGNTPCYCAETKSAFVDAFRNLGEINCSNAFTRNTNYLIANTVLSIACLVVSVMLLLSLLFGLLNNIISTFCCNSDGNENP